MDQDRKAFDEDEDIFNFPDIAGLQSLVPAADGVAKESTPAAAPEPDSQAAVSEAEALAAELEEALLVLDEKLREQDLSEEVNLEEDLFQFQDVLLDPLVEDLSSQDGDAFKAVRAESEGSDRAPSREAALESPLRPAPAISDEHRPSSKPTLPGAPTSAQTPSIPPADLAALLACLPREGTSPVKSTERSRMALALAVAFLVANAALVFFAWHAGGNLRSAIDSVGTTLAEAIASEKVRAAADGNAGTQASITEIPAEQVSIVTSQSAPNLSRSSVELARESIDSGRFDEARRSLARVLANRDRASLPDDEVVEARRLIALAYHLEGQALSREEGR